MTLHCPLKDEVRHLLVDVKDYRMVIMRKQWPVVAIRPRDAFF